MMAKFLNDGDKRLEEVADFEVQTVNEGGEVVDTDWYEETTFQAVFNKLNNKHRKGIEVAVLDYGDEIQATVEVTAKSVKNHYTVIMA